MVNSTVQNKMDLWEVPNIFFGALLSVWAAFVFEEFVTKLSLFSFILWAILILAILSAVIFMLNRAFESRHIQDYIGVMVAASLLVIALFSVSLSLKVNTLINWGEILIFIPILGFWILTIEWKWRWLR